MAEYDGIEFNITGDKSGGIAVLKDALDVLRQIRAEKDPFKNMGDSAKKNSAKLSEMFNSLKRIATYRLLRTMLKEIADGFKTGMNNAYQYSKLIGGDFAASMDRLATSSLYLKNSLGAMVMPIVNLLAPAIDWLIDKFVALINVINQVFSLFSGAATWTKALRFPQEYGAATGAATQKVKELQKTILGFDEINKLNKQTEPTGGGGASGMDFSKMFEESQYEGIFGKLKDFVQRHLQEIEMILAGFEFVLGALLFLTGHPIIGAALMIHGASKIFNTMANVDWSSASKALANSLTTIEATVGGFALGLGAMLLFSGANVPLGLALVAVGAAMIYQAMSVNWKSAEADLSTALSTISGIVAGFIMAVGAIFLVTGHVGIGLGLMIAGGIMSLGVATVSWDELGNDVSKSLQNILGILGAFILPLGLCFLLAGHPVIGIGLMIAGGIGVMGTADVDWDAVGNKAKQVLSGLLALIGTFLLPIGLMLALSCPALFPLGLGLMIAGGLSVAQYAINWDDVPNKANTLVSKLQNAWNKLKSATSSAWSAIKNTVTSVINSITSIHIPLPHFSLQTGIMGIQYPHFDGWWANGGFPETGSLFMARESGPELVGTMGNRNAVANNQQIVEGIRQGVRDANQDEVRMLREQNDLLRQILAKEGTTTISLASVTTALQRKNQRDGGTFVPVG